MVSSNVLNMENISNTNLTTKIETETFVCCEDVTCGLNEALETNVSTDDFSFPLIPYKDDAVTITHLTSDIKRCIIKEILENTERGVLPDSLLDSMLGGVKKKELQKVVEEALKRNPANHDNLLHLIINTGLGELVMVDTITDLNNLIGGSLNVDPMVSDTTPDNESSSKETSASVGALPRAYRGVFDWFRRHDVNGCMVVLVKNCARVFGVGLLYKYGVPHAGCAITCWSAKVLSEAITTALHKEETQLKMDRPYTFWLLCKMCGL